MYVLHPISILTPGTVATGVGLPYQVQHWKNTVPFELGPNMTTELASIPVLA
jgi:hypothetical protein